VVGGLGREELDFGIALERHPVNVPPVRIAPGLAAAGREVHEAVVFALVDGHDVVNHPFAARQLPDVVAAFEVDQVEVSPAVPLRERDCPPPAGQQTDVGAHRPVEAVVQVEKRRDLLLEDSRGAPGGDVVAHQFESACVRLDAEKEDETGVVGPDGNSALDSSNVISYLSV